MCVLKIPLEGKLSQIFDFAHSFDLMLEKRDLFFHCF